MFAPIVGQLAHVEVEEELELFQSGMQQCLGKDVCRHDLGGAVVH